MIYNYVVSHMEDVPRMTIRELAQQLHVSTTSVMRFCNKVGCTGYAEFKFRLAEYVEAARKGTPPTSLETDFAFLGDFIERAQTGPIRESIERLAKLVVEKELVFFIGIGTSGTMGKYGARYLSNLSKNAFTSMTRFIPPTAATTPT